MVESMSLPEPHSARWHSSSAADSDGALLSGIESPLLDVFKSPACAPKDNSCYQDGTSDGAYYEIGGARTCDRGSWEESHVSQLLSLAQWKGG